MPGQLIVLSEGSWGQPDRRLVLQIGWDFKPASSSYPTHGAAVAAAREAVVPPSLAKLHAERGVNITAGEPYSEVWGNALYAEVFKVRPGRCLLIPVVPVGWWTDRLPSERPDKNSPTQKRTRTPLFASAPSSSSPSAVTQPQEQPIAPAKARKSLVGSLEESLQPSSQAAPGDALVAGSYAAVAALRGRSKAVARARMDAPSRLISSDSPAPQAPSHTPEVEEAARQLPFQRGRSRERRRAHTGPADAAAPAATPSGPAVPLLISDTATGGEVWAAAIQNGTTSDDLAHPALSEQEAAAIGPFSRIEPRQQPQPQSQLQPGTAADACCPICCAPLTSCAPQALGDHIRQCHSADDASVLAGVGFVHCPASGCGCLYSVSGHSVSKTSMYRHLQQYSSKAEFGLTA